MIGNPLPDGEALGDEGLVGIQERTRHDRGGR